MPDSVVRRASLFILAASIGCQTFAVNLVTNPSFAGNTNGWTIITSASSFDPHVDATGLAGSGSVKSAIYAFFSAEGVEAVSQCITAGPGNYTLGVKILMPNEQDLGSAGITARYYSGADCTTASIGFDHLYTDQNASSFQTLSAPIIAPEGTTHISITAGHGVRLLRHTVFFDDFVLDASSGPTIPALGPFGLLALMVAVAAIGIFVLRR